MIRDEDDERQTRIDQLVAQMADTERDLVAGLARAVAISKEIGALRKARRRHLAQYLGTDEVNGPR